jgi:porin
LNLLAPGGSGAQEYWGQELSGFVGSQAFVMVDMGHYGVPGGQLQVSWQGTLSSWEPFFPNTLSLNRLAYYQSLFKKRVEFLVGYTTLDTAFIGTFVGGNIATPFGPAALIPFELGMAGPPAVAPAGWVKLNILPTVYNQFGIQRSLPPTANPFVSNAELNPTGFKFTVDDARVLFIDEAGYKRPPAPDERYLWARLGAMYNTSPYTDFSEPGETSPNFGAYFLADGQLVQFEPSLPETAYRGLYLGGSAMYGAPETNAVSQYYEARAYVQGPFSSRSMDQIGLVYFHQVFSHYLRDSTNAMASSTGVFARSSSNTITASYTGRILPGLYATPAISYTDHPTFLFGGDGEHALLFLANLFIVL